MGWLLDLLVPQPWRPGGSRPIDLWTELQPDEYRPWWVETSQPYRADSLADLVAENRLDDSRVQGKAGVAKPFLHFFW